MILPIEMLYVVLKYYIMLFVLETPNDPIHISYFKKFCFANLLIWLGGGKGGFRNSNSVLH